MDYKTSGRFDCKKEWLNKISLYTYLQTNAQMGIQAEGAKESIRKHSIKRRERAV